MNPKTLGEVQPGKVVFINLGVGGYPSRCRVAWRWKDGSVCVVALQISVNARGERLHTTFDSETPIKLCLDYKGSD